MKLLKVKVWHRLFNTPLRLEKENKKFHVLSHLHFLRHSRLLMAVDFSLSGKSRYNRV